MQRSWTLVRQAPVTALLVLSAVIVTLLAFYSSSTAGDLVSASSSSINAALTSLFAAHDEQQQEIVVAVDPSDSVDGDTYNPYFDPDAEVPIYDDCGLWVQQNRNVTFGAPDADGAARIARFARFLENEVSNDYNAQAWCPIAEFNEQAGKQAGVAAEVLALTSDYGRVCMMVEYAVRFGYNVTVFKSDGFIFKNKVKLTWLYGKLKRAQLLEQLGYPLTMSAASLDQAETADRNALPPPKLDPGATPAPVVRPPPIQFDNFAASYAAQPVRALMALDPPTPEQATAIADYLTAHPHVYVGADAFDVVVQLSPRELYAKLQKDFSHVEFLVSGEANLYPVHFMEDKFPQRNVNLFPYPNSGVWASRLDHMVAFLNETYSEAYPFCGGDEDQCTFIGTILKNNFGKYVHDYDGLIFQNMFPTNAFQAFQRLNVTKTGTLRRVDIDLTPVFVHWSGDSKKGWFYEKSHENHVHFDSFIDHNGWPRRPLPDGRFVLAYFLSQEQVLGHVTVYDDSLRLVPNGADIIMDQCFRSLKKSPS